MIATPATINVDRKHIIFGRRARTKACPIARAIRDAINNTDITVKVTYGRCTIGQNEYRIDVDATSLMKRFDDSRWVKRFFIKPFKVYIFQP